MGGVQMGIKAVPFSQSAHCPDTRLLSPGRHLSNSEVSVSKAPCLWRQLVFGNPRVCLCPHFLVKKMMTRSRCVPLLLLVLCGAAEFAEACSCTPEHPQQAYCNADVVIRAKVVGQEEVVTGNDTYGNPIKMIRYDVKQIKMFKGPDGDIDAILTGPSSALCGVSLDSSGKKEYLITGNKDSNGTLRINLCNYIESWESLSLTQKKSFGPRYQMGCDCKVVQCPTIPCSIHDNAECLWTDWVVEGTVQGTQAQYYTCIKRSDSSCAWYRGSAPPKKEFMDTEEP
uniref:Metalloproteinase inhibitor 2 n=2 Tax=Cyprinus carpio TaxID=7962 RepID=A0A8C1R6L6_CYPCA